MDLVDVDPFSEQALYQTAEQLYADLLYHNFGHARDDVLPEALSLADKCEENGQPVNRRVLVAAALFHDAGFHINSSDRFKSKEDYSQYIADHVLPWLGYTEEEIEQVNICIAGTERGNTCPTIESKILRRSDIFNVSQDKVRFLTSSVRYAREIVSVSGKIITWQGFCDETKRVFDDYLKEEDLSLGEWDDYDQIGVLKFISDCLGNITRMLDETQLTLKQLGVGAVKQFFENPKD